MSDPKTGAMNFAAKIIVLRFATDGPQLASAS